MDTMDGLSMDLERANLDKLRAAFPEKRKESFCQRRILIPVDDGKRGTDSRGQAGH